MKLFDIFKRAQVDNYTLQDADNFRGSLSESIAGPSVTEQSALGLSAFYQGVRLLSESVGSLPLKVYKRLPNGDKEAAVNHALTPVLSVLPNKEMTPQELIQFVMASCILRGTAYCEIMRDGAGRVRSLDPLDSQYMHPKRGSGGELVYQYKDPHNPRIILARNVWRVPGLGNDGVTGHSVIALAKNSLGISLAAEAHASKTFSNGQRLAGYFQKPEGSLSDEAFARLKADLNAKSGTAAAESTPLLEEGLTFNGVSMSHDDAQFLESRLFQVDEVARWLNVPPNMLFDLSRSTYSNVEQQAIQFVTYTIRPWLTRIEQTITRDLILPKDQGRVFAEFSIEGLLRGDTASRFNAYASGINNGWLNRNEVRRLENLNSVDGLDEFLVPLNMQDAGEEEAPEEAPGEAEAENQLAAINRKEIKAIRHEHANRDRESFEEWAGGFYSRLTNTLEIEHGLNGDEAEAWANHRLNQLLEADDVSALLIEWSEST